MKVKNLTFILHVTTVKIKHNNHGQRSETTVRHFVVRRLSQAYTTVEPILCVGFLVWDFLMF